MSHEAFARALRFQSEACAQLGSPFYAGLFALAAADLGAEARRLLEPWAGKTRRELVADAVPLRLAGALHDLVLDHADADLGAAFPPAASDGEAAWRAAQGAIGRHFARLAAFVAHEPQTNEPRRSACLLPGFLTVAAETALPVRCLELGASAGLNQLWSRFGYRLGECSRWGDPGSPVQLTIDWRGAPPPHPGLRPKLAGSAACDRAPLDVRDPAQRRRLAAYVWPDQAERLQRLDASIAMALAAGVTVEAADALDWVVRRGSPAEGVATVIFHSIFWQYLPAQRAEALRGEIEAQGREAAPDRPLAWLRMEPREAIDVELRLTLWPGGEDRLLARASAHGAWIEWLAGG